MCIDSKYCIHQTSPYIMLRGNIMAKGSIQNKLTSLMTNIVDVRGNDSLCHIDAVVLWSF